MPSLPVWVSRLDIPQQAAYLPTDFLHITAEIIIVYLSCNQTVATLKTLRKNSYWLPLPKSKQNGRKKAHPLRLGNQIPHYCGTP